MRRWINLLESINWWTLTEDELRAYAAQFVGFATDEMGDPDELTFKLESQFPLVEFRGLAINWAEYFEDDVLRNSKYGPSFIEGDFHTPVVVSIEHGELFIWDGWHRIATAIHRGDECIMAIVGRPKGALLDEGERESLAARKPTPLECAEIVAREWPQMTRGGQYCCDMSLRLQGFMLAWGYEAYTVDLSDHIDAANRPNASHHPEWDYHYVVLCGDLTYDLTYRQFDPTAPCPLVRPFDEIKQEWRDIRFLAPEEGTGSRKQMEPGIGLAHQMRTDEKIDEAAEHRNVFYHGSAKPLPPGTLLKAQPDGYIAGSGFDEQERDSHLLTETIIERYRPVGAPPRTDCVFMVLDPEEIDYAGGYDDYVYHVEPQTQPWRANLNWYSELYLMCEDPDEIVEEEAARLARNYWAAAPCNKSDLYEFLTTAAVVVGDAK